MTGARPASPLARVAQRIRAHDWFTAAIEVAIVVLGIFLGFQVTQWNETRQNRQREVSLMLNVARDLREDVKDWIEVQIVAFPQNTVLSFRDGPQLLEQALKMGADVIGGIPHNEGTPEDGVASLRIIFDLAEKYGVPIDVHCDEIDDEAARGLETLATRALEMGLR